MSSPSPNPTACSDGILMAFSALVALACTHGVPHTRITNSMCALGPKMILTTQQLFKHFLLRLYRCSILRPTMRTILFSHAALQYPALQYPPWAMITPISLFEAAPQPAFSPARVSRPSLRHLLRLLHLWGNQFSHCLTPRLNRLSILPA